MVAHPVSMQQRHLPDRVQGFGRGLEGQRAEAGLVQCHSHTPCIRLHKLEHLVVILPLQCNLISNRQRSCKHCTLALVASPRTPETLHPVSIKSVHGCEKGFKVDFMETNQATARGERGVEVQKPAFLPLKAVKRECAQWLRLAWMTSGAM